MLTDVQRKKLEKAANGRLNDISEQDIQNILNSFSALIDLCGGDSTSDGMQETPYRILKAWFELTEGYTDNPNVHLRKQFDVDGGEKNPVIVKDIDVSSVCEHHVLPFFGKCHIAYVPREKVVGISKLARLVKAHSKRFQIQEKLTEDILKSIVEELNPVSAWVMIEAEHTCMTQRGICAVGTATRTVATYGDTNQVKELMTHV